jgi:hypothetical protein
LSANKSNKNSNHRGRQQAVLKGINCHNISNLHSIRNNSSLTLFVTSIFTDDPYNTLAPDDFAVTADTLDRSTHFHLISPWFACC